MHSTSLSCLIRTRSITACFPTRTWWRSSCASSFRRHSLPASISRDCSVSTPSFTSADVPPDGELAGTHRLRDMAVVIRSKDAGINRLTLDIIFTSAENYEAALHSNVFSKGGVARTLKLPVERIVGTFFVDTCNAIKLSIDRPNISASIDEHDVFGAQQQSAVERLEVPVYAVELAKASSF